MAAQLLEDIGMIDLIDEPTGVHSNEVISTGQAAAAKLLLPWL